MISDCSLANWWRAIHHWLIEGAKSTCCLLQSSLKDALFDYHLFNSHNRQGVHLRLSICLPGHSWFFCALVSIMRYLYNCSRPRFSQTGYIEVGWFMNACRFGFGCVVYKIECSSYKRALPIEGSRASLCIVVSYTSRIPHIVCLFWRVTNRRDKLWSQEQQGRKDDHRKLVWIFVVPEHSFYLRLKKRYQKWDKVNELFKASAYHVISIY